MKKIISVLLIVLIILMFTLAGCSNDNIDNLTDALHGIEKKLDEDNQTYTSTLLTTSNYSKYLGITLYYDNFTFDHISTDSLGNKIYILWCNGIIETTPTGDYKFEKVAISYSISIPGWETDEIGPRVALGYEGFSKCSFGLSRQGLLDLSAVFPTSRYYNITVDTISGFVLIPTT